MIAETLRIDQAKDTPVTARQRARFGYRYAYARSADSRASGESGQDYLAIRENGVRLTFALCDGVSQSFYGNLAARLLGDALVDWLWENFFVDHGAFQESLVAFLDNLVERASEQVATYPLPDGLPPMLRQVLEEKRALGSETTFVAGLLDTEAGVLHLAWMGDSRLRLWGPNGEFTAQLGNTFRTYERWSTRMGRVGELHTSAVSLRNLRYLIAYTDGLAKLDKMMTHHFRDASIQAIIEDALLRPESDDIAFLEVWIGDRRPSERPPLTPPAEVQIEPRARGVRVWWQPVTSAAYYEVRLEDEQSFIVYSPEHALELPSEILKPGIRFLRVRAWDEEPGLWSQEIALPKTAPSFLPPPALTSAPPSPTAELILEALTSRPARSGVPGRHPAIRPYFSWLTPLLVGIAGVVLGFSLALFLFLWPTSPLRVIIFPSPTPTVTPTATLTITPTLIPSPKPTQTPTTTLTPTPKITGLSESIISPLPTPTFPPISPEATKTTFPASSTPNVTFTPAP